MSKCVNCGNYSVTCNCTSENITKEEYDKAMKTVNDYNEQEKIKLKNIQSSCKHINQDSEVSEWHRNGQPDRWRTFCLDCGKTISD